MQTSFCDALSNSKKQCIRETVPNSKATKQYDIVETICRMNFIMEGLQDTIVQVENKVLAISITHPLLKQVRTIKEGLSMLNDTST